MIIVGDCLVSDDLLEKEFSCNINACKGACCIEGDAGAPLEKTEIAVIEANLPLIKQEMDMEGIAVVESQGVSEPDPFNEMVSTCKSNGECSFAVRKNGILNCSIELANSKHDFGFKKPISCHLYPVRVKQYGNYHALNYHRWDICSAACDKGRKENIRVFEFTKSALIRKFGAEWYKELEFAAGSDANREV
jgi:hypothetical protein